MEEQKQIQTPDSQSRTGNESDTPLSRIPGAPQKRKNKQSKTSPGGKSSSGTKKRITFTSDSILPEGHPQLRRNNTNSRDSIKCSNIYLLSRIEALERKVHILSQYVDDLEQTLAEGDSTDYEELN